jgi:hypothetical protein
MLKATYTYSFDELSGKPKRFLESKPDCTVKGYGVSTDTVTLSVLFDSTQSFNQYNKLLYDKFKLIPSDLEFI